MGGENAQYDQRPFGARDGAPWRHAQKRPLVNPTAQPIALLYDAVREYNAGVALTLTFAPGCTDAGIWADNVIGLRDASLIRSLFGNHFVRRFDSRFVRHFVAIGLTYFFSINFTLIYSRTYSTLDLMYVLTVRSIIRQFNPVPNFDRLLTLFQTRKLVLDI